MSVRVESDNRDRGASAIIIAASMFLIMGLAAIVIDGGVAFSERRQAQAGVDFAALAALQAAVSCPSPCTTDAAANNGANEAMDVVASNLPDRTLDWAACGDPNRPAEFEVVSSVTQCVSFTANLSKSRVVLPDDDVGTTFGRLLGANSITVGAFAEAGMALHLSSRIIPHTPTGANGAELCLFSNQAPQTVPPCSGALAGFFGYIDLALYGDEAVGTPSTCKNGDTNTRIAINLAKGGDHNLVAYDPDPPPDEVVNDHAACPNVEEDVNEVRVESGSPTGGITDGLINGVSGQINGKPFIPSPGRTVCNASYSAECASVRGVSLDHTGLWEYLVSGTCPSGTDTHAEMLACLNSGTARFTAAVAEHPRFAAIPITWQPVTGPGNYTIEEFDAVWIETLYFDCNANKCDTVHSPGEAFTPPGPPPGHPAACPNPLDDTRNCGWSDTSGPDNVEGMLAFRIDLSMLPNEITEFFPGMAGVRDYSLTR